jgi:hypothetical protein
VSLTTILAKLISWENNIAGRETRRRNKVMMNPIVGSMATKFTTTKKKRWKKQLTHNTTSYIYCITHSNFIFRQKDDTKYEKKTN